jgi:hypothetical protein
VEAQIDCQFDQKIDGKIILDKPLGHMAYIIDLVKQMAHIYVN